MAEGCRFCAAVEAVVCRFHALPAAVAEVFTLCAWPAAVVAVCRIHVWPAAIISEVHYGTSKVPFQILCVTWENLDMDQIFTMRFSANMLAAPVSQQNIHFSHIFLADLDFIRLSRKSRKTHGFSLTLSYFSGCSNSNSCKNIDGILFMQPSWNHGDPTVSRFW